MIERDSAVAALVERERLRLGRFIRRRVPNPADAEDILQDVLYEFVDAYGLPNSIEQVSAWLFRVARNRIIDRFRKKKEVSAADITGSGAETDESGRLDLTLPATDAGPEAAYARSVLLDALQRALEELPSEQRDVFVAHELEGRSFKQIAASTSVALNTLLARKRYAVLHLRRRLQSVYDAMEF